MNPIQRPTEIPSLHEKIPEPTLPLTDRLASFQSAFPAGSPNSSEDRNTVMSESLDPTVREEGVLEPSLESIQNQRQYSISSVARNLWFLRSLAMVATIVISSLLLIYSYLFAYTYNVFGNTTSYFPWAWEAFYVNYNSVMNLFFAGVGLSLAIIVSSLFALAYFSLKFKESMRQPSISSAWLEVYSLVRRQIQ